MDLLLAKAKSIRNESNASVITYLRIKKSHCADVIAAREEWGETMWRGTVLQTPRSVQKSEEVLQVPELDSPAARGAARVRQLCPTALKGSQECRDPLIAHAGAPHWNRWMPDRKL